MKRLTTCFTVMIALMLSVVWGVGPAGAETKGHPGTKGRPGPSKEKGPEMKEMKGMKGMEGAGGESYGEGPFDVEAMKERLALTDDQMAKLKKLRSRYSKEMIKRRADVRVAELDLFELLDAKTLDMEAAEKQVKALGAIQSDLWLYRIRALKETSQFLTEDQFDQFRKMGFKFMRRMMGRHGQGQGMMKGMGGGMMGQGMMGGMMGGGQHEE